MKKQAMAKIVEINKQELSAQKVELGSVKEIEQKNNDLFQALKEADKAWRNYQDYLTGAGKPFDKMIAAYSDALTARDFAEGAARRFVKAGKELGVDVSSNADYKKITQNLKSAQDVFNIIRSFDDPSKFQ